MKIKDVRAREVINSRGIPTVEATVYLENGINKSAIAPNGASVGMYEALELVDNDKSRFLGKGATKAVKNVNEKIAKALINSDIDDIYSIDKKIIELDSTKNKSFLGANATCAVSMACVKAAACLNNTPLYKYLGGITARTMPVPMMNILNGGVHSSNNIDIQEFMIMPIGAKNFTEGYFWCCEVYQALKNILHFEEKSTSVGDEGGFAPDLENAEDAIEHIILSIIQAGFEPKKDFVLALDCAASGWKSPKGEGVYYLPKSKKEYTTDEIIEYFENLVQKYPICSIEDCLDENDWQGWQKITQKLSDIQLVGDDLFTTNPTRLNKGIQEKCANSVLIKINQIGTVTEAVEVIKKAQQKGYKTIISHRSGDSEDTFIADFAVGLNSGQIKSGAPARSERVAKYNRLIRIEEELKGFSSYYSI